MNGRFLNDGPVLWRSARRFQRERGQCLVSRAFTYTLRTSIAGRYFLIWNLRPQSGTTIKNGKYAHAPVFGVPHLNREVTTGIFFCDRFNFIFITFAFSAARARTHHKPTELFVIAASFPVAAIRCSFNLCFVSNSSFMLSVAVALGTFCSAKSRQTALATTECVRAYNILSSAHSNQMISVLQIFFLLRFAGSFLSRNLFIHCSTAHSPFDQLLTDCFILFFFLHSRIQWIHLWSRSEWCASAIFIPDGVRHTTILLFARMALYRLYSNALCVTDCVCVQQKVLEQWQSRDHDDRDIFEPHIAHMETQFVPIKIECAVDPFPAAPKTQQDQISRMQLGPVPTITEIKLKNALISSNFALGRIYGLLDRITVFVRGSCQSRALYNGLGHETKNRMEPPSPHIQNYEISHIAHTA